MSQLIFYYGTMKSGKSLDLIKTAMNYWTKGEEVLIIKPIIDDRDGEKIKTRLGMEVNCKLVPNSYGIISQIIDDAKLEGKEYAAVLIDEAQFFSQELIIELSSIADNGIPVIAWGLKVDFRTQLFEGSKTLIEMSDKIKEIKTVCQFCGKKATLNLRTKDGFPVDADEDVISIGDEEYYQVCRNHYFSIYENPGEKVPESKSLI